MTYINRQLYIKPIWDFYYFSVNRAFILDDAIKATHLNYKEIAPQLDTLFRRKSPQYRLFYYIYNDFLMSMYSLYNYDIDKETTDFSYIQMLTRHAIESFFDLFCLCNDSKYISVLKYDSVYSVSLNEEDINNLKSFPKNSKHYSIRDKKSFAEVYAQKQKEEIRDILMSNIEDLFNVASNSNKYIHPNVLRKNTAILEKNKRTISTLLKSMAHCIMLGYYLIYNKYWAGKIPCTYCFSLLTQKNKDEVILCCKKCFVARCNDFENFITNYLFEDTNSPFRTVLIPRNDSVPYYDSRSYSEEEFKFYVNYIMFIHYSKS